MPLRESTSPAAARTARKALPQSGFHPQVLSAHRSLCPYRVGLPSPIALSKHDLIEHAFLAGRTMLDGKSP